MVAELLRLRLQTIGNTVRFGPRRLTVAVASVLAVLIVTIAVASLVSGLRDAPLDDVRALAVQRGGWEVVADERRDRGSVEGAGAHHHSDLVVRLRRASG